MKNDAFVHLCQPDEHKSCGACCGIYNYADSTKEFLVRRLRKRTGLFRINVTEPEELPAFSQMIKKAEDQTRIYNAICCCEYAGFLDTGEKKVGCLLHPFQNHGIDLREFSFYGKDMCEGHFCPSCHYISREEKESLIFIIDDWYLYGLCVTDIDLVKEYFRMISNGASEMPAPRKFRQGILKEIALRFFSFKVTWPFRSLSVNRFGKYYFDGSHYMVSHIDYNALGCDTSRFDRIFLSLCSEFNDEDELKKSEGLIQSNIDEFIRAYVSSNTS
jgi:hypothetical protein